YLENPLPGMRLEKTLPLKLRLGMSSSLDLQTFSFEAKASYSALFYPLYPTVSLVVDTGKKSAFGIGLGVTMDFTLSSLFPASPSIIRNTSLVGNTELILGSEIQGRFSLGLENMVNSHLFYGASFVCFGLESFGVSLEGGYVL
ncbi:MAG: hypothetical protein KBS81_04935, partial [Spirochaetales bacterium]|nr:hypothetical protein [Candidatus Physcosoma equi]